MPPDLDRLRADLLALAAPDHARLIDAMQHQRIPAASQHALLRLVLHVEAGSVHNGYTMARAMGRSRREAQNVGNGSAVHQAVAEYLGSSATFEL